MITIAIGGPRGTGKTTTAIAIARMLRGLGQHAVYLCGNNAREHEVEGLIRYDGPWWEALDGFSTDGDFEIVDAHGETSGELEKKLLAFMKAADRPKSESGQARLAAMLTELVALIDEAEDVDPTVFARFTADERKGFVASALAIALAGLANA